MQLKTIVTYLSLFLSISVSTLAFVNANEVIEEETYSLTLSTNPTRLLSSSNGRLEVQTFDAIQPWNAGSVGPDNGRRWTFNGTESVINLEIRGALAYFNGILVTNSGNVGSSQTNIRLVPAGGGIKIQTLGGGDKWVNDMGKVDQHNAAIWMISHTTEEVCVKKC